MKEYKCGLCGEPVGDLSIDEVSLREHYWQKHPQYKTKKNAKGEEITIQLEPHSMKMERIR